MTFNYKRLASLGISFENEAQAEDFWKTVEEKLEIRVGELASEGKSEETMSLLEESETESEIRQWLAKYCPDYIEIVRTAIEDVNWELLVRRKELSRSGSTAIVNLKDSIPIRVLQISEETVILLENQGIFTIGDLIETKDLSLVSQLSEEGKREIKANMLAIFSPEGDENRNEF